MESKKMAGSELRGKIIVPSEVSIRIDKYLAEELEISRTKVQRHIKRGRITVNGDTVRSNHVLHPGDVVEFLIPPPRSPSLTPEDIPLSIKYEDESLMVIDKPAGMVVHPAPGSWEGTLVNAVLYYCRDMSFSSEDSRPGIVHRLDKDTSGLIIVAKNEDIKGILSKAISSREIIRTYITLTLGHIKLREGIIDTPIGRHPTDRRKMSTFGSNPREASTAYRILESYDVCELIEVNLITGRTHQIRAHFSSIGHPVVGDTLYYGGRGREKGFLGAQREKVRKLLALIDRQALHAYKLQFQHPLSEELITLKSEYPQDIENLLVFLRKDS
jgi:23S rRNA pseudouridine1911/1915/1917 synthase